MVLSNKKLKQRLRVEVAESLIAKTEPISDGTSNPESSSQSHSFRDLLGSASQRPILSKREKRRKIHALRGSEVAGNGNTEEKKAEEEKGKPKPSEIFPDKQKRKQKKRKRDEEEKDGVAASEENGVVLEKTNKNTHNKKKKKKKKNKKKQKKANTEKEEAAELQNEELRNTGTNENSNSQTNEDVSTKVYVGGIPYYSTEEDIRSYFESCGTITEVDCMKFPESGKFRGIAIISFKTEAAAKRALALDGADMGGLFLKIQPYKANRTTKNSDFAPEIVEGYNRIYIGNLSWDVTEEDLKKLFSDCKISSIRFGMDKETGQFRGYAHVDFSNNLSLTMALQLDQKVLHGRPVRIRCAVPLKGGGTQSKPVPIGTGEKEGETQTKTVLVVDTGAADTGLGISSGKLRRRTCYECGEKGHLSSDCPKNRAGAPADSNAS